MAFSVERSFFSYKRIGVVNEAYAKRRDRIKNRISSNKNYQKMRNSNNNNNIEDGNSDPKKKSHHHPKIKRKMNPAKIVPTHNITRVKKSLKANKTLEKSLKIEEWTEKLLEEARDSLELIEVSVQTETVDEMREIALKDQLTQTDDELEDEHYKVSFLLLNI